MNGFGPGLWPVSYAGSNSDVFEGFGESGYQGPDRDVFEAMATELLWNWSNRVFGTYEIEVRPTRVVETYWVPSSFEGRGPWPINPGFGSGRSVAGFPTAGSWIPVLVNGAWFNIENFGGDLHRYVSHDRKRMSLPGPVQRISSVVVEGTVLDPSVYRLETKRWLVRQDGDVWPIWQNLDAPEGGDDTWSVAYTRGVPVPVGGQVAAGVLAAELALASVGSEDCRLPARLSNVSREGVTIAVVDPYSTAKVTRSSDEVLASTTGIWAIDSWVSSVNAPRPSASVRSVDTAGTARWGY